MSEFLLYKYILNCLWAFLFSFVISSHHSLNFVNVIPSFLIRWLYRTFFFVDSHQLEFRRKNEMKSLKTTKSWGKSEKINRFILWWVEENIWKSLEIIKIRFRFFRKLFWYTQSRKLIPYCLLGLEKRMIDFDFFLFSVFTIFISSSIFAFHTLYKVWITNVTFLSNSHSSHMENLKFWLSFASHQ